LSNGKANTKKSLVDEIIKLKRQNVKSYGQQRQRVSSGAYIGTSGQKGGSDSNDISTAYLKTAGDTMIGPLAFYPKTQTIASGVIDVAQSTGAYSSRVYIIGQGSAADNLEVILGSSHAGQILFFQPIVAAITLQSYLKTATAWSSSSVSYNVGDVVLYLSQRYTCYVAHTSSGSITPADATKWHRNNIRITGATEQVVAVDEIILLQYDSTDGVWTVVSGGGSGSSGAGLADDNVWTGINTFNGTATSINSATINLGDSSGDAINIIGTVSSLGIPMGGNDINDVGQIEFSSTSHYIKSNSVGFEYRVPVGDTHEFFINGVSELLVTSTSTTLGGDLDLATNDIQNVDQLNFEVTGQRLNSTSSSIQYEVPTGDYHNFLVNSSSEMTIRDTGVTITNDLTVNDDVTLGATSADLTTHNGLVNYATNYSAVGQPASTSAGYITIQVGGVAKKLYYYS
jgi:hypothetical protein